MKKILLSLAIATTVIVFVQQRWNTTPDAAPDIALDEKTGTILPPPSPLSVIEESPRERADIPNLVQVPFTFIEGDLKFRDALNIPRSQYESMGKASIEALERQRFEEWKKIRSGTK